MMRVFRFLKNVHDTSQTLYNSNNNDDNCNDMISSKKKQRFSNFFLRRALVMVENNPRNPFGTPGTPVKKLCIAMISTDYYFRDRHRYDVHDDTIY